MGIMREILEVIKNEREKKSWKKEKGEKKKKKGMRKVECINEKGKRKNKKKRK